MLTPVEQVITLRRKLLYEDRDITHARDRTALLEGSDRIQLLRETSGHHRHVKLLRHCVRMSQHALSVDLCALDD